MQLKTSTNIAIKFTLYVIGLFLILGITINLGFFFQRSTNETTRLNRDLPRFRPGKVLKEPREKIITLPITSELLEEISENTIIRNIAKIDDTYIIYDIKPSRIKIIEITHPLEMQHDLLWLTIIIITSGALLTFLVSRLFVKSSLYKIRELVDYVSDLDIHKLTTPVPLS